MPMHAYRSTTCAGLTKADVGQTVRLSGWVHRVRDHGGLLFIDLRDHYGMTQVLCDPDSPVFSEVEKVRSEWCIRIDGEVKARDTDLVNPKIPTGEIEVFIRDMEVLGAADELPLPVFGDLDYPEETRLKYRYLDLRRESLHDNIMLRSQVVQDLRQRMWAADFTEFQTPIITASSPEGARDFLVPSRLHPGKFYALPQAPQQFKQLIMVGGFDKYFQIAPCFRDEDPRADRSPTDFYQLDLEMSFVEQDDVFATIEPVMLDCFERFGNGRTVNRDVPQISFSDAALWYGTDKPDLRNPIKMQIVSEHFAGSGFAIFAKLLEQEGTEIRAIPAPKGGSRKFCDRMNKFAQEQGLPGMGYIIWQAEGFPSEMVVPADDRADPAQTKRFKNAQNIERDYNEALRKGQTPIIPEPIYSYEFSTKTVAKGPLANNIGQNRAERIRAQLGLKQGDAAFFLGGKPSAFEGVAGRARVVIGEELSLTDKDSFQFCWVVDFPMYERDDEGKVDFSHNPFSMPQGGIDAFDQDPEDILGYQYDLACNGCELVSGAIRNHKPEIMYKAFELAGYGPEEVEKRFGGMLNAFKYGAPPHGGCAAGIDRMVMLLADEENIREVIMFPMTQRAEDLMLGGPTDPTNEQLRELHLRLIPADD